jgi:thioredoxin-related protein
VVFGADALNALSTNVWFNLFFFFLLVIFAVSFLGAFEITLPSAWVNRADQASDRGGLLGIFFMAFTLSLVSFSCTGPIIGTLLVEAAVNGGVMGPIMGMTGFSLALALPFGLFAAFPGWLNSMPKSGGWLNSVKVTLGLLELALALKFLSNADLVVQAGLLQRELFLAIWIAIFGILALYLFGFIHFPHDSKTEHIGIPRFFFGLMATIFTIYLIPGMWGAPLKVISGFPPPQFYSESPTGLGGGSTSNAPLLSNNKGEVVGDPDHCPHGLPCFHDYEKGMAYARESGKPVLLDFTGWACVNCRKMEEQVWSDPRVLKLLGEDYVLISLYVDEKTALPESEQIEVQIGDKTKKLRTIGNRWSHMQATRFGTNSQPYYVVLDHNERQIGEPAAYDPDIEKYIKWLEDGLKGFGK